MQAILTCPRPGSRANSGAEWPKRLRFILGESKPGRQGEGTISLPDRFLAGESLLTESPTGDADTGQSPRPIRRVGLIFNPVAGRHPDGYRSVVDTLSAALAAAGVKSQTYLTQSTGSAEQLALQAIAEGCDAIFACGGDGTVHEVLQSMVGKATPLGVIPMGTANALAINLGLRGKPEEIVAMLLSATPTTIPVGRITTSNGRGQTLSRYFIVAAGVGADALLVSRMDNRRKRRWGYLLYLWEGVRIWARYHFPLFECELIDGESGARRTVHASELLAIRIRDFGGAVHSIAPGATLLGGRLRLLAFKTQRRIDYFRFLIPAMIGRQTFTGAVELLDASQVVCRSIREGTDGILAEADGEVLGGLPVVLEVVPNAVRLLIPKGARP